MLFPNCLISGLLIFVWIVAGKTSAGLIVFALVYGFASGAFVSMLPASVVSTVQHDAMPDDSAGVSPQ